MNFRPSTLEERKQFYEHEFSREKVNNFFKNKPQLLALDAGTDSGIIKNKKDKGNLYYLKYNELNKKIKKYVPEDIYYDRNSYKNVEESLR